MGKKWELFVNISTGSLLAWFHKNSDSWGVFFFIPRHMPPAVIIRSLSNVNLLLDLFIFWSTVGDFSDWSIAFLWQMLQWNILNEPSLLFAALTDFFFSMATAANSLFQFTGAEQTRRRVVERIIYNISSPQHKYLGLYVFQDSF